MLIFFFVHFIDNIKLDANQRSKIDRVQEMFVKGYIHHKQLDAPDQSTVHSDFNRLLKLLLKVNALRSLEPDLIEELYFSKLIGILQINNVIPHILNLGSDCSNDV